ncbi:MAG: RimK/LysX family protein [Candidatus Dojkabacteria bacterium]|nr:RimK/LysX family protein [Candidatus Dojkabacteria bacterium]
MFFLSRLKTILGINERNLKYIRPYNPVKYRKYADNKLLTKKILLKNNIPTPKLIAIIKDYERLEKFNFNKLPDSIVVKPQKGFGGEGILIFFSNDKYGNWLKADKTRYSIEDLKKHIRNILDGNFSLKNEPDIAFFEERVMLHPDLKKYASRGMPDIRVIVFNQVPIMAQLRLPTFECDGKANLHAGGVGVGIDLTSGVTTTAVHKDRVIEYHPDNNLPLRGIAIPYWNKILELAVKAQTVSKLGFVGVDIVLDRLKGPMVLEINARPGLAIQIANQDGVKDRLERIVGLKIKNPSHGIKVGKNLFGGEIEEEIEQFSGKKIIGYVEYIYLYGRNEEKIKIKCKNDTGAFYSSIDEDLASILGYKEAIVEFKQFIKDHNLTDLKTAKKIKIICAKFFEEHPEIQDIALIKQSNGFEIRPIIRLKFELNDVVKVTDFTVTSRKKTSLIYKAILGRKALRKNFIIIPAGKFKSIK